MINKEDKNLFKPDDISDWFWEIVSKANKSREKLRAILMELSKDEIYQFQDEFLESAAQLKDEPFIGYIGEDESEDGIDDICNWVISQGKEYYVNIWKNPKAIPSHIDVSDPEILFGIADEVYEEKFGEMLDI